MKKRFNMLSKLCTLKVYPEGRKEGRGGKGRRERDEGKREGKEKEGEKEDGETGEGSRMGEMPLARLAPSLHFLESRCSTHLSMSDMIICIMKST